MKIFVKKSTDDWVAGEPLILKSTHPLADSSWHLTHWN